MAYTTLKTFYEAGTGVIKQFDEWIKQHYGEAGTVFGYLKADHICYKCGSTQEYETLLKLFEDGDFHQAKISGRRIAYIKLIKPFKSVLGDIQFLELSDQKPDGSQKSKFEHIEYYPLFREPAVSKSAPTFENIARELKKTFGKEMKKIKRPHHTTYDIEIGNGRIFRLEPCRLVEKIGEEFSA